jgi:poly-gamma-glutamate capsule biosynthesis protein CapA/YwtB (metallophosphatase superfamily)
MALGYSPVEGLAGSINRPASPEIRVLKNRRECTISDDTLVIAGVGDVGPFFDPEPDFLRSAGPFLASADILVGNCERLYATGVTRPPIAGHDAIEIPAADPASTYVFEECGFDVVSLAANHTMDLGAAGMDQTIEALRARGIQTIGAGCNSAEARRPAFVSRNGITIAFLAYCSIMMKGAPFMKGQAAGLDSPGIAPLRAHTSYEQTWDWEPGSPGVVRSLPDDRDLYDMRADVAAAKQQADIVVVMMHWGVHFIPHIIAEYQPIVARVAFDAGADAILGHHAGVPKAIEMYGSKPCFYSLGYFLMSVPERTPEQLALRGLSRFGIELDPEYPRLPFGRDSQRSLIARLTVGKTGIQRSSFVPVRADRKLRPEVLRAGDPRAEEAVQYIEKASAGFDHVFQRDGDEIEVCAQRSDVDA